LKANLVRILIVEDSEKIRRALTIGLSSSGFAVDAVADGEQALAHLRAHAYPVVLLDLMLPKLDGLEVLRICRSELNQAAILVLSARDQVLDRVTAINLGADDYLVKPFAFDELLARVKALARRRFEQRTPALKAGLLTVNPAAGTAKIGDQAIALTPREFGVLELMLRARGRLLSRALIFQSLWPLNTDASDKVVEVTLSGLRRKLQAHGISELIINRRGLGYLIE